MDEQKIAFFIDDDPNFLALIPDVVQHPRFRIQTYCAVNGYRTIDEIIKVKPDVLFIDFYLPRANGGQILPILKSVQALSNLPVYFLTGYSKEEILPLLKDKTMGPTSRNRQCKRRKRPDKPESWSAHKLF